MAMHTEYTKSTEGEDLVVVRFERAHPNTRMPQIEVIFTIYYPIGLGAGGAVLSVLSATRMDTRQPVTLTDEESRQAFEAAAEFVAEE